MAFTLAAVYILTLVSGSESHETALFSLLVKHYQDCRLFLINFEGSQIVARHKEVYVFNGNNYSNFQTQSDAATLNRRFGSNCALTFARPSKMSNSLRFFHSFVENFVINRPCVTQGDEDRYVFLLKEKAQARRLLLDPHAMELKFKLAVYQENSRLEALTLCFFCGNGRPALFKINVGVGMALGNANVLFPDFTFQGNGHVLRASCQTRAFFIFEVRENTDGQWNFKRGYGWSLLATILKKFNYSHVAFPSEGGGSGTLKEGKWNGAVGDILSNRADIAVAVTMDMKRLGVIVNTHPMAFEYLNFVLGEPSVTYTWKALAWPLSWSVWLGIGTSFIGLTVSIHAYYFTTTSKRRCGFERNVSQHVLFTLLEQNIPYPAQPAPRFLMFLWLLSALVFTTAYRSKLVGIMTFPVRGDQPSSFAELAQSKHYAWGLEGSSVGSSAHNFFLHSPSPLFQKIYKKMEFEPDARECLLRAMRRNNNKSFACLTFNGQGEYLIRRNYSNAGGGKSALLRLSPDSAARALPGIAMKLRAVYRSTFNIVVDAAMEMGLIKKWQLMDWSHEQSVHKKWVKRQNGHNDTTWNVDTVNDGPAKLSLEKTTGPFALVAMGTVLSIVCFIAEQINWNAIIDKRIRIIVW